MSNTDTKSPFPDLYKASTDDRDIRASILRTLYEAFFNNDAHVDLEKLPGLDDKVFQEIVSELETEGSIGPRSAKRNYRITASGVLVTEEDGLVSEELAEHNRQARILILNELTRAHDESNRALGSNVAVLATNTKLDLHSVISNLRILSDFDYVKPTTVGSYVPTEFGAKVIKSWQQWEKHQMTPS